MHFRRVAPTLLSLHLMLLAPGSAKAQRELPLGLDGPTLRLEVVRPLFGLGQLREAHFVTSVWDATLVVPLGWPTLFAQLGFGLGEIHDTWSSAFANPRIGVLFGQPNGLSGSLYAALPLEREMGGDFAKLVGSYAHFEEWDRFGNDSWGLSASGTAKTELDPGAFLGIRLGGTVLIPTDDELDSEAFASFGLIGDAPAGPAKLWFEISGIGVLTEPEFSFVEVTSFFATLSVSLPNAGLAPEAYVRVPLDDDISSIVSFILGARIHVGHTRAGA